MKARPCLTVAIPTLGRSPILLRCLEAAEPLRALPAEIVVATERRPDLSALPTSCVDRWLEAPQNAGFSGACNVAIAASEAEFIALINDDAVVRPGWAETLLAALRTDPSIAAAQSVNLMLQEPHLVDGCGIAWTARWQAIQIDHARPASEPTEPREIFGVSGTAAVFRRSALEAAALRPGLIFDPALHSYYEDVDLAGRLRAAGFRSLSVPSATALHAGATSTRSHPRWRYTQIYGNRLLVLARLLGRSLWPRLPTILLQDLLDLTRALVSVETDRALGLLAGWGRAIRSLPAYLHTGSPLVSIQKLREFREPKR